MRCGVLIYAHNSDRLDYLSLAVISAGLAKQHLGVPVSLVTDSDTLQKATAETAGLIKKTFETLITVDRPDVENFRNISDGKTGNLRVPFINSNRSSAWDLTPYDRTLLIDSDYLIFTPVLSEYWNVSEDVLIGISAEDLHHKSRLGINDQRVADTGIKMYWATTVMFTKNNSSKTFFNLVEDIKKKYVYYSEIYGFDPRQYRNDIAFSIAKHILSGFKDTEDYMLPPILSALPQDKLYEITDNRLHFLLRESNDATFRAVSVKGRDIHVMNKSSILENKNNLLAML